MDKISHLHCPTQLLDTHAVGVRREKMYKLDEHVSCAVAGLTGVRLMLKHACNWCKVEGDLRRCRFSFPLEQRMPISLSTCAAWLPNGISSRTRSLCLSSSLCVLCAIPSRDTPSSEGKGLLEFLCSLRDGESFPRKNTWAD